MIALCTIAGAAAFRTSFWTFLAPSIDTISALWALRNALSFLLLFVALGNFSLPTCDSCALSTSEVARDTSLIVPVGKCLRGTCNQAFHLALVIIWSAELEKAIFALQTVVSVSFIALCASNRAPSSLPSLLIALLIRSIILHLIPVIALNTGLLRLVRVLASNRVKLIGLTQIIIILSRIIIFFSIILLVFFLKHPHG